MRIAQKMGYHRDGDALGLNPFETEMRRRIWWHIMVRDSIYGSLSRLTPSLLPIGWDTKEPQSLNDADLFPKSTESARPREGPTEMAFCIVLYRISKVTAEANKDMHRRLALDAAILGQTPDGRNDPAEIQATYAKYRQLTASLEKAQQELVEKYVDPKAGNTHIAAHSLASMLTRSLLPALTPIQDQPEWGVEILTPEDNLFKILIAGHDHLCDAYEVMLSTRFEWWMGLYFQPDSFTALTGQLCQRPTGSLSDRAWKVVDRIYQQYPELLDLAQKQSRVQARYTLKAWEAREAATLQTGQTIARPAFISQIQDTLASFNTCTQSSEPLPVSTTQGQEHGLLSQLTELDTLVEGYDPFEATATNMNWDTWEMF